MRKLMIEKQVGGRVSSRRKNSRPRLLPPGGRQPRLGSGRKVVNPIIVVFVVTQLVLLWTLSWTAKAEAQPRESGWSVPFQLSNPENNYISDSHAIVSDQYGYTHLFWLEEAGSTQSIYYSRFDGTFYSAPLDIHTAENPIAQLSPVVDTSGTLHLLWTEGGSYRSYAVHYKRVAATKSLSSQEWTNATVLNGIRAHLIHLQTGSSGALHLLYSNFFGAKPGLFYVQSQDSGETWSSPYWLDPDILPGYGPGGLQFVVSETGTMHALWFYQPFDEVGGDWIRYARSTDEGSSWSTPVTIDRNREGEEKLRAAGPRLAASDDMVHVIWAANLGSVNLRHHRVSHDDGETWSAPKQVLGRLNGQAGDGVIFDHSGRLHFASQLRFPQGIYYASWDRGEWTRPDLVYLIRKGSNDLIGSRYHAHNLKLSLHNGNQLVLLFYDRSDVGPHTLYEMHYTMNDLAPLPTIPPATSTHEPVPAAVVQAAEPTATPVVLSPNQASWQSEQVLASTSSPASALQMALIPSLLLLLGAIAVRLLQRTRYGYLFTRKD